ncbi:MAG: hypothetical protein ACLT3H_01860 [Roseburia sp.]
MGSKFSVGKLLLYGMLAVMAFFGSIRSLGCCLPPLRRRMNFLPAV